ncbi:glycosyltransferase family 4 protein [Streptomyces malaysiensis]|uniref:glycosyltransferase family 4 protein n=1 Tax=Streptomyces malaysiensis TaxID=92644 RepID=UPI000C99DFB4|nr:glycosyltransferase family 4 protein [Streptomyces malaysiensis]
MNTRSTTSETFMPPRVVVALHEGFYGAVSGTGFSNRALLLALTRLLPPGRLVVLPTHVSADQPGYDKQWAARLWPLLRSAEAEVIPIGQDEAFVDSVRERETLCGLVGTEAARVAARSGRCLLIGLDVPFLGLGPYVPESVDLLLVPRSTAVLTHPHDRARLRWERAGLRSAVSYGGRIAAISQHMHQHLRADYGVPERALLDLPNGLVPHDDDAEPELPLPARARAGFLLAMGRAVPEKGFEGLLHALALLRQRPVRLPHLVLVAASTTPNRDHYLAVLDGLIREYRLNATLITSFSPAVRSWLRNPALRAVIVPSRVEPFGRIPLEAFGAQAGPVVATRAGGLAQTVLDGVTGFTARPGDPESLAAAIQRALTVTPREREQLASAGAALVASRHNYVTTLHAALARCAPWSMAEAR